MRNKKKSKKPLFLILAIIIAVVGALAYFVEHSSAVTFPSTSVLDNFNRAGTTAPPSSNWTNSVLGDSCGLQLSGDSSTAKPTVTSTGQFCAAQWNASTFGPDTEAYATVGGTLNGTGNENFSLFTRISGTNYYEIEFDGGTTNNIIVQRVISGSGTSIGTLTHTMTISVMKFRYALLAIAAPW
jgi:hypothetical protein